MGSDYASFINAPDGPPKTAFTYETFSANLVMARAHAGDDAKIGATPLRKLLKVVDMMQDPDGGVRAQRAHVRPVRVVGARGARGRECRGPF